jgi:hypothetical protein
MADATRWELIRDIVARFERAVVEQYQRGGVTASAKAAIDRSLDGLNRARSPKS